tara:strand:+ start:140987 stop:141871 length:885 start_codon:yes stop_codon:yes gene_type:complete
MFIHAHKRLRWAAIALLGIALPATLGAYAPKPITASEIQLDPSDAETYLDAGEWLAASAASQDELARAHQVLAVGIGLAHRQGEPGLAASLCIALAASEPNIQLSESLWDFALMLDPSRRSAWRAHRNARSHAISTLINDAARCVWAARMGDQKTAGDLFNNSAVREGIKDAALQAGLDPNSFDRILSRAIRNHDFDDCRGRVFIIDRSTGEVRRIVCEQHAHPLGTLDGGIEFAEFIRVEAMLHELSISQWESAVSIGLDETARDPSISMLETKYKIDLSRPYLKANQWVSAP